MITGVAKIAVRSTDQRAAVEFWSGKLGFEILQDETYGEERWVEIAAPDGTRLVLTQTEQGWPEAPEQTPDSPIFFACEDVVATHKELAAAGVKFVTGP